MFLVFRRDTGELIYTADAEALQHFDADVLDWYEVTVPNWAETHCWNPNTRSLEELPISE